MPTPPATPAVPADPQAHGETAAARLREALALHGLVLPSLWRGEPVHGQGSVELGGCTADVADALALVLEGAAPRTTPPTRRKRRTGTEA
ncbi:hypothetical protein PV377_18910 [Streptomyces ipomoeae]|uniref:hypothetical protein n=1 Tax=Streptomyces ipomoeae TaxID=103232 RepID=UPI0029A0A82D|nr:hypothetical protein [Streptomyces ipomoeae]MDX2841017.1 hypothetical protein [Streptomyces ipomoeae]